MATQAERNQSLMLKVIAGLVSIGFSLLVFILNNLSNRIDGLESKFDKLLLVKSGMTTMPPNGLGKHGEPLTMFGLLPEEIKSKQSATVVKL